jgi:formylglycine-generating enzyme required for sulfatase activity
MHSAIMLDSKRPLKVFLCHAHADRDAVRALYTRLTNDGVDAWLDKEKLLPGQDWELEIKKAVREADVVVVCLSKQFNQRGFRQKEVRLALDTAMEMPEGEIFIIPARLEECDNLENLRKWHWVDLFESNGYEMLMRALRARADKIGATLQIKKKWLLGVSPSNQVQKDKITSRSVEQIETNEPDKVRKPAQKLTIRKLFGSTVFLFWSIFVFGAIALLWKPFFQIITSTTEEKTPQVVTTSAYTETVEVHTTSTVEPTITPTPLPTEITDAKGVSMVLVPAGEFTMGREIDDMLTECGKYRGDCSVDWFVEADPSHQLYLEDYYIDKFEVTNALYRVCVDAGVCSLPESTQSSIRSKYYDYSPYDNYPVISVSFEQAESYCEWRDAMIPSEAQWEKAARGIDDRYYPWGNDIDCSYANYSGCISDTNQVDGYKKGRSYYGVFNMAGNVEEYVIKYSYPLVEGEPRRQAYPMNVVRGGSFRSLEYEIGVSYRNWSDYLIQIPADWFDIGFRCAKNVSP